MPLGKNSTDRTKRPEAEGSPRTPERLIRAALSLFAQDGIKGVSLRRIVAASGAANISALHYHFGNRWALVTATAAAVYQPLGAECLARLGALQGRAHGVREVREVLEALYLPAFELRMRDDAGRDAIRFVARLSWEFGAEGQILSGEGFKDSIDAALALLQPLLPDKDGDALRLHLIMTLTSVYHGLADLSYLWNVPFRPDGLLQPEQEALRLRLFFDYIEAGLRCMPQDRR
jgi:AcrR family transcriptional regulator